MDISHMIYQPVNDPVFLYWNVWFAQEEHQQTTTEMLESADNHLISHSSVLAKCMRRKCL